MIKNDIENFSHSAVFEPGSLKIIDLKTLKMTRNKVNNKLLLKNKYDDSKIKRDKGIFF